MWRIELESQEQSCWLDFQGWGSCLFACFVHWLWLCLLPIAILYSKSVSIYDCNSRFLNWGFGFSRNPTKQSVFTFWILKLAFYTVLFHYVFINCWLINPPGLNPLFYACSFASHLFLVLFTELGSTFSFLVNLLWMRLFLVKNSFVITEMGSLSFTDLNSLYFSINRLVLIWVLDHHVIVFLWTTSTASFQPIHSL